MKNRISKWVEERDKRAKGQAGFRPKHSMVDHGITLRHIIEKVWEKKEETFCCFVDLKKAFDTVPRDKLWINNYYGMTYKAYASNNNILT